MRVIEIDDVASWEPVYAPFFASLAPPEEWQRLLDPEGYSSADFNIEKLARSVFASKADPVAHLRDRLDDFYRSSFTYVALYHGCRITDVTEYERDGVLRCDIARLHREALALWGDRPEVRMALTGPAARRHAESCNGNVGLWYSRAGAVYYGRGYTAGGSEFLRVVGGNLGETHRAQLEARGWPAVIRCVIPLQELHPEVLRSCASLPLRWKLTRRDPDAPENFYTPDWAFMHPHAVPPDRMTIEFLPEEPDKGS